MSEEFQIAIFPKMKYLSEAKRHLCDPQHFVKLRSVETLSRYQNHLKNSGVPIKVGLQENWFPYDNLLLLLRTYSEVDWMHYVYASLGSVYIHDLIDVAQSLLKSSQYIVFINTPEYRSMSLPHGHIIVPSK